MTLEEENAALRAQLATFHHYVQPLIGILRMYRETPLRPVASSLLDRADECCKVLGDESDAAQKWQTEVENRALKVALEAWSKDLMQKYADLYGEAIALGAFTAGLQAGATAHPAFGMQPFFKLPDPQPEVLRAIVKEALKGLLPGVGVEVEP